MIPWAMTTTTHNTMLVIKLLVIIALVIALVVTCRKMTRLKNCKYIYAIFAPVDLSYLS